MTSIHPDEAHPIIVLRDTFDGPDAAASKVFSLNLMAQGAVETPAGPMTPALRTYDGQGNRAPGKQELPSAGTVFPLAPGLSRLRFTGQWVIDWDLYILAGEPQQAHIGNWAHLWHPGPEQAEFQAAQGREFEERQHILRVKGTGAFQVLILPQRKEEPRDDVRVVQEGDVVRITSGTGETILAEDYYAFFHGGRKGLATFAGRRADAYGLTAEGGPVEVLAVADRVTVSLHGTEGVRRISVPGEWEIRELHGVKAASTSESGVWTVRYAGGAAASVVLGKAAPRRE